MKSEKPLFAPVSEDKFFSVLKERVNKYFSERKISHNANSWMIFKTVLILSVFFLSYVLMISGWLGLWGFLAVCAVNGFCCAQLGLNIGHDAIHGSYSSNSRVNKILSLSFNIVGANDYMWSKMHNVIHHTYTNVPDHDDDINQMKIIRLNPAQPVWWIHRFQYIYVFLFYSLASLSWVLIKDYVKFFQPNIGSHDNRKHPAKEYFRLFGYKFFYYFMFLVLPLMVVPLPWYQIVAGFLLLHVIEGYTLSLVFQMAHVVEGPSFPKPDEKNSLATTWAAHQMHTTANFASESSLANFICGGLNFQIEHHLFPRICHVHYKNLSPIVKETAREFGLPYYENKTFIGAMASHIRVLKRFGRK